MKAFFVKEYVKDERFKALVENVLNAKNPDDLLFCINELDFFVCEKTGIERIKVVFADIKDKGVFEFDDYLRVNEKFRSCDDNLSLIEVYFHEKRHQFQYTCYLKNDYLLGINMIDEIKRYLDMNDLSIITKRSVFGGIYGYYGRLVEQDAYLYAYEQMIELLNSCVVFYGEKENDLLVKKYKKDIESFTDSELLHWIEEHKRRFEIRKEVELILLKEIRNMINRGVLDKDIKKIIFSEQVFNCLDKGEREKLFNIISYAEFKDMKKSEEYLEKLIKKRIKEFIKQKKSR